MNAEVEGNKTNHSLRATGAIQLYESGVPEKVIQEQTGNRSLEALRIYEHSKDTQDKVASMCLRKLMAAVIKLMFSRGQNMRVVWLPRTHPLSRPLCVIKPYVFIANASHLFSSLREVLFLIFIFDSPKGIAECISCVSWIQCNKRKV